MDFLRKLGLNKYECLSYLALLKEGAMSAYNISDKSAVPFGRVYDSLKVLENKGLIEVIPGKPKKYLARSPKISISTLLDEKADEFESMRKEIDSFSEFFKKSAKSDYEITVLTGKHNFAKCLAEHFDYKKEFYATREAFKLEKWFPSIQRYATQPPNKRFVLLDKKKADMKRISELKKFGINFRHYPLENVRFLVSDEELVTISIQDNNEYKTIHARSKSFGRAMARIIKDVWNKAEEI